MKKTLAALALAAGMSFAAAPAFATGNCTTTTVHVPAVTETVTHPATYETEYEFVFKKDHPKSPRWETDPNWNADSNERSRGWHSTGATRQHILTPERSEVIIITPAFDKPVETCAPAQPPATTPPAITPPVKGETPATNPAIPTHSEPGTGAAEQIIAPPAEQPAAPEASAPVATVPEAVTPAAEPAATPAVDATPAAATAALPTELAHTGPADWALPAGALLIAGGAALIYGRHAIA